MTLRRAAAIIAVNLVLLVVGAAVLSVGFELYLRVRYGERFAPRPVFYNRDATLGWVPSPRLDNTFFGPDFAMRIATDDHGCRLGARGAIDPRDEVVVLLGDSYVFGWGVSTDETITTYLDDRLAVLRPHLRALNLAVGGYGTLQMAARLEGLVRAIDARRVRSIYVLHVHNDMTDNVTYSLFRSGFNLPVLSSEVRPRSALHTLNLLEFRKLAAASGSKETGEGTERPAYERDVLYHFPMSLTGRSSGPVTIDPEAGTTVPFESLDLSREADPLDPLRREALTPLQRDLIGVGVRGIACAGWLGIPIHHALIPTAPEWFAAELAAAVAAADACGNDVSFEGKIPIRPGMARWMTNAHSGRHYSPAFNEYLAARIARTVASDFAER
jgi:hypothetical protein